MSDKLHPGKSHHAVGHEFSIDESTIVLDEVFLNRSTYKHGYVLMDL